MMPKYIITILTLCLPAMVQIHCAIAGFASAEEAETIIYYGDLNKDGIEDKVVIETPKDASNMMVRESDGYVYNFNQPILYVYFGDGKDYKLYKRYENVIPRIESEFECLDLDVGITDRGVLRIAFSLFYSAGSYGTSKHAYLFRYQDGDFFMIGEDCSSGSRSTGKEETVSKNYVTHKKQTVVGSMFDDGVKPKETWTKLPVRPLERLGKRNLK